MLFSFLSQYPVVDEAFPICDFPAVGLYPSLRVVVGEKGICLALPVEIVPAKTKFIKPLPDFLDVGRCEICKL